MLYQWLEGCDVRDEHGQAVHRDLRGRTRPAGPSRTRTRRSAPCPHPPSTPPHDGHASSPPDSCTSTRHAELAEPYLPIRDTALTGAHSGAPRAGRRRTRRCQVNGHRNRQLSGSAEKCAHPTPAPQRAPGPNLSREPALTEPGRRRAGRRTAPAPASPPGKAKPARKARHAPAKARGSQAARVSRVR